MATLKIEQRKNLLVVSSVLDSGLIQLHMSIYEEGVPDPDPDPDPPHPGWSLRSGPGLE